MPTTDPDPEEQIQRLALRLRGGDDALGAFYEAAFARVRRLCRGFLACGAADAEDLAQDAMLRLVGEIERWNPSHPFAAWQRTVVLNMCRNHRRSERRRSLHEEVAVAQRRELTAPDPADQAMRREVGALVDECLGLLPPREREAFVLVDLDGMQPIDAADVMGVAGSTVRAALTMARRRLRDALAPRLAQGRGRS